MTKTMTRPTIAADDVDGSAVDDEALDLLAWQRGRRRTAADAPARDRGLRQGSLSRNLDGALMLAVGGRDDRRCACPGHDGLLDDGHRHLRWWWPHYG